MANTIPRSANQFIEQQLDERILALENELSCAVMAFSGPLLWGVDDVIRDAIEAKRTDNPSMVKLAVILTTTGGYAEVVQRIVETMRKHYNTVDFIVPNVAFSAGTIMALSGDAIHMDYYSRLGPIDPQVENNEGHSVPALGYLARYEALIEKAKTGTITMAEVQLLIHGFDQAELYQYEQAKNLSITLLKAWLVKYKFKNWTITRTRHLPVTAEMRRERAEDIANQLNNTAKWHSHGRGISMDELNQDVNLLIDDLEENKGLHGAVRAYDALLADYMNKMGQRGVLHTKGHYTPFM